MRELDPISTLLGAGGHEFILLKGPYLATEPLTFSYWNGNSLQTLRCPCSKCELLPVSKAGITVRSR